MDPFSIRCYRFFSAEGGCGKVKYMLCNVGRLNLFCIIISYSDRRGKEVKDTRGVM